MDVLTTARLRLRWFEEADAPFVVELLNEPAWIRHIYDAQVRTAPQAVAWIRDRLLKRYWLLGYGFWAVERLADGQILGLAGLIKRDGLEHPDIGYGFPARFWGHGYAREAAAATFDYARQVLGLRDLMGTTGVDNHASGRVLMAIGLRDCGVMQTAAHDDPSHVYRWNDERPTSDAAEIAGLRFRWHAALTGAARPALSACIEPAQAERLIEDRHDLTPAALDRLAALWAPLADDTSLPTVATPMGWRLRLPEHCLADLPARLKAR